MIGVKIGTGGSAGHGYLNKTVEKIIEKAGDDKIIVMRASNMSTIKRYFKGSTLYKARNL